ncbi:hypothetical protein [Streptomyces sp. PmtA]|uniref:hypothetical protein n=1 Tax=Streptomyces sp. PmtA TaxID=3074275 RepID=UPI003014B7AD
MRIVASAGGAVALALAVVPMTPVQAASLNPDNGNDRIACSTSALTNAIDGALAADGGTIELARGCRYVLTSALPTISEPPSPSAEARARASSARSRPVRPSSASSRSAAPPDSSPWTT